MLLKPNEYKTTLKEINSETSAMFCLAASNPRYFDINIARPVAQVV